MAAQTEMVNMMTMREVCQMLHVHPNTLRRWCDQNKIRSYRITARGDRRFLRQDVARFVADLTFLSQRPGSQV